MLEMEKRGEGRCGREGNLGSGRDLGAGFGLGLGPRRGAVREEEEAAAVVAMGGRREESSRWGFGRRGALAALLIREAKRVLRRRQ
jgi:hypothetical protein